MRGRHAARHRHPLRPCERTKNHAHPRDPPEGCMIRIGKPPSSVPNRPAAYLLKDARGRVIYVGKAKNLRNRLRAYTGKAIAKDAKVEVVKARAVTFDFIVAESETEALILECNLIKEHRPRYNVKLRDDKKYPFIKVTLGEDFPRAYITRLVREDGSRYFGPYTDAKAIRRTLKLIRQVFPIRSCRTFKENGRPCLDFQIDRCLGPCCGAVTRDEYAGVIKQLCLFLNGRAEAVLSLLRDDMSRAARALRFEEAARVRDRIRDVEKAIQRQRVLTAQDVDRDVVAVARHSRLAVASVVRVRHGKLIACENCSLALSPGTSEEELIETFLKQFYSLSQHLPREILVDRELPDRTAIERWLTSKAGFTITCQAPKRGEKKLLGDFAKENAKLALMKALETRQPPKLVAELRDALRLPRLPRLISAVDVSNTAGANAVGTVVSFLDGHADRSLYRRYRIRTVKGIDDYAMMREVVERHLRRLAEEGARYPDLLLVDGGRGQLSAATEGTHRARARGISLVALAKKEEEIFVPGRSRPVAIPEDSSAKKLLMRIRNEAHRFSVTYHRTLRTRGTKRSILDEIPGVGEARKKALLRTFGSVEEIRRKPQEELAHVPGIGIETAKKIKRAFEKGRGSGPERVSRRTRA